MGFIEDLRRQKAAEEQATVEKNAERKRLSLLERAKEEREKKQRAIEEKIREEDWRKAKSYFDQTGLRQMAQLLVSVDNGSLEETREGGSHKARLFRFVGVDRFVVEMTVSPDGAIAFEGEGKKSEKYTYLKKSFWGPKKTEGERNVRVPLKIEISKNEWSGENGREVLENALEKVYKNPRYCEPHDFSNHYRGDFSHCLPGNSLISVPNGFVPVKNLKSGDLVWTVDRFGHKVQAVIVQEAKRLVSKDHKMVHIVLEDGRKLIVSPGYPTIDNKELGSLKKGQILDNSKIVSLQTMSYKEKYTYDILPSGKTGGYWANNILIESTLSSQFKKIQWHRQLFV